MNKCDWGFPTQITSKSSEISQDLIFGYLEKDSAPDREVHTKPMLALSILRLGDPWQLDGRWPFDDHAGRPESREVWDWKCKFLNEAMMVSK